MSALPPKADIKMGTALRLLVTQSGHKTFWDTKCCLERLSQEEVYRIVSSFSVAIGQIDRTNR